MFVEDNGFGGIYVFSFETTKVVLSVNVCILVADVIECTDTGRAIV